MWCQVVGRSRKKWGQNLNSKSEFWPTCPRLCERYRWSTGAWLWVPVCKPTSIGSILTKVSGFYREGVDFHFSCSQAFNITITRLTGYASTTESGILTYYLDICASQTNVNPLLSISFPDFPLFVNVNEVEWVILRNNRRSSRSS